MKMMAKLSLLQTTRQFLRLVYKSTEFWRGMLLYSIVFTFFYHVSVYGQFLCSQNNFSCLITVQLMIIAGLILGALCYIVDFYRSVFKNGVFKCNTIISFDKNKLKSIMFLIAYVLVFVISMYFAKVILLKPANPDWKIEFIYFVILFLLCVLPVFAMRFSAIVAFYLHEQKIPSFKFLYDMTVGHSFVCVVGFLGVILFLAIFNMQVYGYENVFLLNFQDSKSAVILITFFDAFIKLFSLNVLICFFEAQRELMENQTITDSENNTLPVKENAVKNKIVKKKKLSNKKTRQ